MKPNLRLSLFFFFSIITLLLSSCKELIEPNISNSQLQLETPADQFLSTSYTVGFWWDKVDDALKYRLQVVSNTFALPGSLVLDTVIKANKFSFNFNPGQFQWRVMAMNGSSQTAFTSPRSYSVASTSIKQQSVQLSSPANNYLTNQSTIIFQWGSLYGATKYQIEIDTNNFVNESAVIANVIIPGQQYNFTFPKDQVYQWRVKAQNDTAQAKWSAVNTLTFDHTPPGKVTLVAPTTGQTLSKPVSLQWNSMATTSYYKLYVLKSDSITLYSNSFPMIINNTNYSFNVGNSGDRVYWKVTAVDAAGNESMPSQLGNFVLQ